MNRSSIWVILLLLMPLANGCKRKANDANDGATSGPAKDATVNADQAVVDEYLTKWDRFAQGENQLVPYLRDNKSKFESSLARLLRSHDRRGPARLVFYPVVQVGGAIPVDSPLGSAAQEALGADFHVTTNKQGQKVLFSADLYSWWQKHEAEFEHFQVFDDWLQRDFAKKTVLPMYERLQRQAE